MTNRTISRPLLLSAFAAGIGLSAWISASVGWGLCACLLGAFAARRKRLLRVLPVCAILAGLAVGNVGRHAARPDPLVDSVARSGVPVYAWVRGRVLHSEPWPDGSRCLLRLTSFETADAWRACNALVRAYLPIRPPVAGVSVEASLRLQRPRGPQNPGEFDRRAYLRRKGILLTAGCRSPRLVRIGRASLPHPFSAYRHVLERRLRSDAGADSGLLLAVLLGERGLLTTGQRDALSRSGLFHLVALSGLHVGLLLVLLALVAHLAGIPPAWRDVSGLCLLIVYGLLASASPSLVRALFMAGIFLAACLLARPQGALYAWSVSLAALLIWNPAWILDTGFQLTFAATLGIIGLWNAMPAHFAMEGAAGWITRLLWVGFSAQLSTLPILALDFHRISPLGWLATPLASVPIMAIQVLGLPYILGLAFVPGVHQVLGKGLALSARIFMVLPTRLGAAGWGSIFIPRPALVWTVLFVAGLCALAVPGRRRRAGWVLATVAVVGAWTLPWLRPRLPDPSVVVLDVGEASCQVFCRDGRTILFDAGTPMMRGTSSARTVIEPFLAAAGRRRVDGIVLTHWDSDHSGATPDLLRDLDVGFVAYPATDPPSRGLPGFIARTARSEGVSLIPLRTSDTLRVGAFRAEILHPDPDRPESSENDRCLVARIREGGRTFLVTGDIEADAERHILEGGLIRPVFGEIVPHHGSATSSTPPWVQASSPRAAFFSVGRANRFGHPAQSVLQRYIRIGSSIFRTDRDGALLVAWPSRRPMVYRMRNGSWLPPPRR